LFPLGHLDRMMLGQEKHDLHSQKSRAGLGFTLGTISDLTRTIFLRCSVTLKLV
jgi:hypothetical protein